MVNFPDSDDFRGRFLPDGALVDEGVSGDGSVAFLGLYVLALVVRLAVDFVGDVAVSFGEDVRRLDGLDVAAVTWG